uniref:Secreted protein n=1 Tax=Steinernema glaseri TaxID=37863 RepID=A0A1I7XXZ8_9BILA
MSPSLAPFVPLAVAFLARSGEADQRSSSCLPSNAEMMRIRTSLVCNIKCFSTIGSLLMLCFPIDASVVLEIYLFFLVSVSARYSSMRRRKTVDNVPAM